MFGIKHFTSIINPPQGAILAVGSGIKQPIVNNDKLEIGTIMNVTLSCDHRVIDGATGSKFLAKFKKAHRNAFFNDIIDMNTITKNYDLIVVGGGPGGYVAAIRGSQMGMKVGLIEKDELGGICLNWGCIPTKALLRTSEIKHLIDNAEEFGISIPNYNLNFDKIIERSRNVSNQLSSGVKTFDEKNKIDVFNGVGKK